MSVSCKLRYVRYLGASIMGSVFTLVVMSMREAALYSHLAAQAHQHQTNLHFRSDHIAGRLGTAAIIMRSPLSHNQEEPGGGVGQLEDCEVRPPEHPWTRGEGAWQVFIDSENRELMVYGAYYDDRKAAGSSSSVAVVRVFGVASTPKTQSVFCQFWYERVKVSCNGQNINHISEVHDSDQNRSRRPNHHSKRPYGNPTRPTRTNRLKSDIPFYDLKPVLAIAKVATPGRGYTTGKHVHYQEYLFSCPLHTNRNDSRKPMSVSLTFQPCQNSTILFPVTYAQKPRTMIQFGVCVAAAYGDIPPQRLAEWAELLSILGVGEINAYLIQVTNRTERTLTYYQQKGLVQIHRAPSPLSEDTSYWAGKLAVIPGFNDCMYRNMYRYNYTIIVDFDEIIVPHMHTNYSAMMADLRTFHSRLKVIPGLMLFRNAYFFLDMGATSTYSTSLSLNASRNNGETKSGDLDAKNKATLMTAMSHTRRVDISPRSYAAKSMFNARACIVAWNHFCLLRLPRTPVLQVDPLYALLHHYKPCHFRRDECATMMARNVTDTAMLKFRVPLRRRLKKIAAHIINNT